MSVKQVILVEPDKIVSDLYSINLSSKLSIEVIATETSIEAISFLGILPDVSHVICKTVTNQSTSTQALAEFIEKNKLNAKLLVYGDKFDSSLKFVKYIQSKVSPDQLVEILKFEGDFLKEEKTE